MTTNNINKFRKWLASKIEPPTVIKLYIDTLKHDSGVCTFHYKKDTKGSKNTKGRGIIKIVDKLEL